MDREVIIKKAVEKLNNGIKNAYKMQDFLEKVKHHMKTILPPVRFFDLKSLSRDKSQEIVHKLEDDLHYKKRKDFWVEEKEGFPEKIMILEDKLNKDNKLQSLLKEYRIKEV